MTTQTTTTEDTMKTAKYIVRFSDLHSFDRLDNKRTAMAYAHAVASDHGGAGVYLAASEQEGCGCGDLIASWDSDGKRVTVHAK
jgi:hypothetical protein